jgi:hypothetical protein
MHAMLAVVQRQQEMVEPSYLEQAIWKTRFGVRNR